MQGKHFHTIEIMFVGFIGALIGFNVTKMLAIQGAHRDDILGDLSRAALNLVK
jgi:hypothetical protein